MSFFPIGPDFVFGPRDPNFKRMSLRNEIGRQLMVQQIAVDPSDPNTIYILSRPGSGGANVFRTDDGGASWMPLFDDIQRKAMTLPDGRPGAVAVDPVNTDTVYVATDTGKFFYSTDRGAHWSAPSNMNGVFPVQLLVDQRTSATQSSAVILAATASGLLVSATGGASWSNVLSGQCVFTAASFAGAGGGDYYASIAGVGLFYANSPSGPWTDLTAKGIGLPAHGTGANVAFDQIAIALCQSNNRAYAWLEQGGKTKGIFTSNSPSSAWQQVGAVGAPDPGQGTYSFGLSVAPNSPGDGQNDILFFPGYRLFRSVDSGRTWTNASASYDAFHNDIHHVVFAPNPPPAGVVPATYVGCDGGLALSTGYADPTVTLGGTPDFNSSDYVNNEALQNLNHGLNGIGVYTYACDPNFPSLGYLGAQDTAMAASSGALGWRGLDYGGSGQQEGDGFKAAVVAGSGGGMKVWFYLGAPNYIRLVTDTGTYVDNTEADCTLGPGGPRMVASTNMEVGLDGQCLAGGRLWDDSGNTLTTAVNAPGPQTVTPKLITGVTNNVFLAIDGGANQELVQVTSVSGGSFTAKFSKTHAAGVACQLQRVPIVRIDQSGNMVQISQDFGPLSNPVWLAIHPTDPNTLYCVTQDQRVFATNAGASANASTVWTEVTTGKPSDLSGPKFIVGMSVDAAGNAYVLCSDLVHVPGSGEFLGFDTPLFTVNGGMWIGQSVATSVPSLPQSPFGLIVADPVQPNTLYVTRLNKVFRVVNGPSGWDWSDISDGLPGSPINDLWIGNIGGPTPKVLLRVAVTTRGIFERDVTAGATEPAIALYMRANVLDLAHLPTPPSGVFSPLDGVEVFHYQCADIKIDAQNRDGFFQTDPEDPPPISHVIFDQLRDNSENLPSTDAAQVHVQVHNRSAKPTSNVQVWALYANASAGLPALPGGFVKNFLATGKINGTVPPHSVWQPVGAPQKLDNVATGSSQVATWSWNIPTLAFGSPGHYCVAAFVHSAASPFTDPSSNVDDLAIRLRQVGQKNVHVGPPLNASPFPPSGNPFGGASAGGPAGSGGAHGFHQMREYCEFHNATATTRQARIVLDLRGLPPQLEVAFRLSRLQTVKPLASSITGAQPTTAGSLVSRIRQVVNRVEDHIENAIKPYLDPIEDFFENVLDPDDDHRGHRKTIPIDPTVYHANSPGQVTIDGVVLGPNDAGAIDIIVRNTGVLPPGSIYWFQVEQWAGGQLIGGSLYQVRVAGVPVRVPVPPLDLPPTVVPNYPLWAASIIEADRERLGITDETS